MTVLQLSASEFWELTPRQIGILNETYARHEKRWDVRFASLWWRYVNGHRLKNEPVIPFEKMFPELISEPEAREPEREKTPDEIMYNVQLWALAQPNCVIVPKPKPDDNVT